MNLAESLSFKAWDSRGKARADASLPCCVAGPWPCVPHSPLWAPGLIACLPCPCRVHVPLPGLCPAACGPEQDTGVCSLRSPSWQGRRKIMLKLPLFFYFFFFFWQSSSRSSLVQHRWPAAVLLTGSDPGGAGGSLARPCPGGAVGTRPSMWGVVPASPPVPEN